MTQSHSSALTATPSPRAAFTTIYRDKARVSAGKLSARAADGGGLALAKSEDLIATGIFATLTAALVPTLAYALWQTWSLLAGNGLTQAIRVFLP